VERIGIGRIREIVVEDCEGIAMRLDEEVASSKAAYKDPWKEAYLVPELQVIS
jgi:nitrite reductase (NADH) large subunit